MEELRTDPRILSSLRIAAKHQQSADEIKRQTVSFVASSLADKGVTRVQVQEALKAKAGA